MFVNGKKKNIKEIVENIKKEEEGFHIFITIEFISEKKPQKGTWAVSLLAKLLSNVVGGVIGL